MDHQGDEGDAQSRACDCRYLDNAGRCAGKPYLGRIVEIADTDTVFKDPQHPYTRALLDSVLTPDPNMGIPNNQLGASYPNPIDPPTGCSFHPRCVNAMSHCATIAPNGKADGGHYVECHLYDDAS